MFRQSARIRLISLFALACALATPAVCADEESPPFDLPRDPQLWINSPPWRLKQLAGKGVLLYFFEEECPRCAARWQELKNLAKDHQDDPLLFVAVSSGTQRDQMEAYAQEHDVNWAILLDPERTFEKSCGIGEINLDNVMQAAIIDDEGMLKPGSWDNLEASIDEILQTAHWTVDPKTMPPAMKSAWRLIEFQNYPLAAAAIRKGLKSPKDDVKAAAEELLAVVQPQIDELAAAADADYDSGQKFSALRGYTELMDRFRGFELPETVAARKKELQADPAIKIEAAAMKAYEHAARQVNVASQRKKGITVLKRLVKEKPDTEAGQKAQALLQEQGEN